MLNDLQLSQIVSAIYQTPELYGVTVGYYDGSQCRVAHPGFMPSRNYGERAVIIEEVASGGVRTDSRIPVSRAPLPPPSAPATAAAEPPQMNGSRIRSELIGAGLSCGATALSAVGVVGSAAAEVPTAGASTFLLVASWVGLVTSGVQCINGIVRSVEAIRSPETNSLQQWDDNQIYSRAMFIVDALGVASAVVSLPQATRNLVEVLRRQRALVLTVEELTALNRAGRAQVIREAVQRASRNPETARMLSDALAEAGLSAERIAQRGMSVRHAERAMEVITSETTRRVHRAVMEVIGGVGGPGMSALPGSWVGSASGSVNTTGSFIIHLMPGSR